MRILWFCEHTVSKVVRSGIQRVVIEAGKALNEVVNIDFVKWDAIDGQLRYVDKNELAKLFGKNNYKANQYCHRRHYRFGDTISKNEPTWLIYPEIPYHLTNGNNIFARIISQCREYGIRTATIFYDLVPIRIAEYKDMRNNHEEYIRELLRCDIILAISDFSRLDLLDYYFKNCSIDKNLFLNKVNKKIHSIPLAECGNRNKDDDIKPLLDETKPTIIMVGAIEPRKQQTRFLKVLNDAKHRCPILNNLIIKVFGSLHSEVSLAFQKELLRNPNIKYYDYADDKVINQAYKEALFSVFPSYYEGFGLPIVESLQNGVPCLTANFGAMKEVAARGGCYLVDVQDDNAIQEALIKLISDETLLNELRGQIKSRPIRTWVDYAKNIVNLLMQYNDSHIQLTTDLKTKIFSWLGASKTEVKETFVSNKITVNLINIDLKNVNNHTQPVVPENKHTTLAITRLIHQQKQQKFTYQILELIANSDILLVPSEDCLDNLIQETNIKKLDIPFPYHVLTGEHNYKNCFELVIDLYLKKSKALDIELSEELLVKAYSSSNIQTKGQPYELAVVISTYNRADFVAMNVEWIIKQISSQKLPAVCVVVDNTSTDNTYSKLSTFLKHPSFKYICNSANIGMLGNLRECSCLNLSKFVWFIGDDDFIVCDSILRTLDVIKQNSKIPFIFHNFAVYYREKVSPADSPNLFIHEGTPLEIKTSKSGSYPVYKIAAEHDNLFTAIYPIVFRADLAAACFNYPFNGTPFGSLIESIPTTKYILESYASVYAYWIKQVGVVGNAYNRWSHHRPRWHMVLVPQALALAKDVGVDPKKIWRWLQVHKRLFYEAIDIATAKGSTVHLDQDDFNIAYRLFREKIIVPENLKRLKEEQYDSW